MKENTLFKLDLLQSYYLQKPARFGVTKQMLRSDKYQTKSTGKDRHERHKHKLLQLTRNEAFDLIKELQKEAFGKKVHFIETNVNRNIVKVLKKERQKNLNNQAQLDLIDPLLEKDSELLNNNLKNKIYKVLLKSFPTKLDLKNDTFEGVPQLSIDYIKTMKSTNPYKTNTPELNNLFSRLYAEKSVKQAIDQVSSMEIVWGPKTYEKSSKSEDADAELAEFDEEVGDSEDSDSEDVSDRKRPTELKDEDYEQLYDGYKDHIAASSDEEADELALDPAVNYNEITDEEPSDEEASDDDEEEEGETKKVSEKKRSLEDDDFFAKPVEKRKVTMKNIQLPALATGYYSGGESEGEKDDLVDEITEPRKNRRGQRARQKIWEKKYGKTAKHVIKEHERSKSDRERMRLEFEERQAKREAKQQFKEQKGRDREERHKKQEEKANFVHPSWEAKLKQQEALKNAKFEGKKITFD